MPVARKAGASPKSRPVNTAMAAVKASTCRSGETLISIWLAFVESIRTSSRAPQTEDSRPQTAPAKARRRLSVSNWRITRDRDAPIARRTEISRWRDVARARSRLAMLTQAISSTRPTTDISVNNAVLYVDPVIEVPAAPDFSQKLRLRYRT